MRRVLVTGGAGFIGSNFVRMLLDEQDDCFVVNLDKLTYAGNLENLQGYMDHKNHFFVRGDICDLSLVQGLLEKHDIEYIVNFAAESHVDRSITGPKVFIDTNVSGTLSLLQAAVKVNIKRFLQVSTDEVYGSLGDEGMFVETTPLSPNSPYSASKASSDLLVRAFGHTWGLAYNITRCSNNYGPYQFPEKLIPLMIHNAQNDKSLPVYGDGLNVRDWLYVYDHCSAIWKVLTEAKPGEIYNIGGCNEKANIEVVKVLLSHLGKPESLITYVKDRPGHDLRYAIDAGKIMNDLAWSPSVTFEQGMKSTIDWYLSNQKWLDNVVSGDYERYYDAMYGAK
jgi:dTDP-glucose 4,6-dehydratase